jgi:hypothetical protein
MVKAEREGKVPERVSANRRLLARGNAVGGWAGYRFHEVVE